MEASHKTHRPHIKVGKDEEKKKKINNVNIMQVYCTIISLHMAANLPAISLYKKQ